MLVGESDGGGKVRLRECRCLERRVREARAGGDVVSRGVLRLLTSTFLTSLLHFHTFTVRFDTGIANTELILSIRKQVSGLSMRFQVLLGPIEAARHMPKSW